MNRFALILLAYGVFLLLTVPVDYLLNPINENVSSSIRIVVQAVLTIIILFGVDKIYCSLRPRSNERSSIQNSQNAGVNFLKAILLVFWILISVQFLGFMLSAFVVK